MSSGGGGDGSAGYRYYFGIHAGLGRGEVDELVEIRVGTKLAAQPRMTASGQGSIDMPNLFGGDTKEGGIKGNYHLMMGEPTQVMPAPLAAMIAPAEPTGFRRMVTFFYDGLVAALNPYPKPWSFRVRRATKGWDGEPFRPDLAVIDLLGPEAKPEDAFGSVVGGTYRTVAPAINGVKANLTPPPGRKITQVLIASYANGDVYTEIPISAVTIGPTGTAVVELAPAYYGLMIDFQCKTEHEGGGDSRWTLRTAPANIVERPVRALAVPLSGNVITDVTKVERYIPPMNEGGGIGQWVPVPVLGVSLNGDGSATIDLPPSVYMASGLTAYYRYASGGAIERIVEINANINNYPLQFVVPPPANGVIERVTAVEVVIRDAPSQYGGDGDQALVGETINIAYTFDPATNLLTTYDARASGANVQVSFQYRPNLNPGGSMTPERQIRAMNPAHIIYECLTNREWGRGFDRSVINTPSMEEAAQTLFNEGFGMCMMWSRRDDIDAFIQSVLNTINAVLFDDPVTALITLKLIRKDYNAADLKIWDTSNGIVAITSSAVNTASVIVNEVIVKYREVVFNEDRTVNVQNLASLQSGSFKTLTKEYKGIPTSDLARRVAQRDLRANAEGLRRFTITMDRRGSAIHPGSVMRFRDEARQIPTMVLRVATKKGGTQTEGLITLEVVQDVFAMPASSYTGDQPNTWVPPNFTPCIGEHEVFEVPYFLLARNMTQADFAYVTNESAYVGVVAEQAKGTNTNYDLAFREGPPTEDEWPTDADAMYCGYEPPAPAPAALITVTSTIGPQDAQGVYSCIDSTVVPSTVALAGPQLPAYGPVFYDSTAGEGGTPLWSDNSIVMSFTPYAHEFAKSEFTCRLFVNNVLVRTTTLYRAGNTEVFNLSYYAERYIDNAGDLESILAAYPLYLSSAPPNPDFAGHIGDPVRFELE